MFLFWYVLTAFRFWYVFVWGRRKRRNDGHAIMLRGRRQSPNSSGSYLVGLVRTNIGVLLRAQKIITIVYLIVARIFHEIPITYNPFDSNMVVEWNLPLLLPAHQQFVERLSNLQGTHCVQLVFRHVRVQVDNFFLHLRMANDVVKPLKMNVTIQNVQKK